MPATPVQPVHASDYTAVTETWGLAATPEQVAMMRTRYRMGADLGGGGTVLEVGSGAGMGLPYLRSRSRLAVGGDYTAGLLRESRAHVPEVPVARFDAQALPFVSASFDAVLLLEMVYYVPDLGRALAEARRVLRPGGSVLISVPNPDRRDFNPSPHSFEYPNAPRLAELLKSAGLEPAVYGGFAIEEQSGRDSRLAPLRRFAVRHHLIPRSMRLKGLVKRALYGPLPRLGAVTESGTTAYRPPVVLPGAVATPAYKTLYAIGRLA